jgi:hypothetical protein
LGAGSDLEKYDTSVMYVLENGEKGGRLAGIKIPGTGLSTVLALTAPARAQRVVNFTILQEEDNRIVGGNTFVLRAAHP